MPPADPKSAPDPGSETTADLLRRALEGEPGAADRLVHRYLPMLRSWAHGRLPSAARDVADTDALVRTTLARALDGVRDFRPRREGAFLASVRGRLLESLQAGVRQADPAPVARAVGAETLAAYERALASLPERGREAVILRVEFGYSYREVADAIGSRSEGAARTTVTRALAQLAETMEDGGG